MKLSSMLSFAAALFTLAAAAPITKTPISPVGPCADHKVDKILKGEMDPSECCSYGNCVGDVVVSVG